MLYIYNMNNCVIPIIIIILICSLVLCCISGTWMYQKKTDDCMKSGNPMPSKSMIVLSILFGAFFSCLVTLVLQSSLCMLKIDTMLSLLISLISCCLLTLISCPFGCSFYMLLANFLSKLLPKGSIPC